MLTKAQVTDLFKSKIHCSQIVLGEVAEELGYGREEAYKMANPFGGGCFRGDTCGAVAGAMIAIGMKYGNDEMMILFFFHLKILRILLQRFLRR